MPPALDTALCRLPTAPRTIPSATLPVAQSARLQNFFLFQSSVIRPRGGKREHYKVDVRPVPLLGFDTGRI